MTESVNNSWRIGLIGENEEYSGKFLTAMSTANSKCTGLGSNSDVRGESPATECLSFGVVLNHLQFLLAANREKGCYKVPKI
jgi:hypothetical protein